MTFLSNKLKKKKQSEEIGNAFNFSIYILISAHAIKFALNNFVFYSIIEILH